MNAFMVMLVAALATSTDQEPLEVGTKAPPLTGKDIDGKALAWEQWDGRAVLLFFHSEDMAYSNQALHQIVEAFVATTALRPKAALLLVTNGSRDVPALHELLDQSQVPVAICVDPDRKQFSAYHVVAFPTAICIDPELRIVHISKGFGPVFAPKVMAGASLAAGLIDREEYLRRIEARKEAPPSAHVLKVARTVRMVRQLIAAGMLDEARNSLLEVLEPDTDHLEGIGLLAEILVLQGRLDDARTWIDRLAKLQPTAIELRYLRAGLALAEQRPDAALKELDGLDVSVPRVALLKGRALEAKGQFQEAARLYRQALESLLRTEH